MMTLSLDQKWQKGAVILGYVAKTAGAIMIWSECLSRTWLTIHCVDPTPLQGSRHCSDDQQS